jgi:hypothetical protein
LLDPFHPNLDRGNAEFDIRQRVTGGYPEDPVQREQRHVENGLGRLESEPSLCRPHRAAL